LIGREAEQEEVRALLAEARLVTLVGSGGVGKTRLALAVTAALVDQYPVSRATQPRNRISLALWAWLPGALGRSRLG
jgi:predicted ATPase